MDIYQICLDEVALEGLDGITISALWLRLNQREKKIAVKLSLTLQEILWKFLLQHSSIEFYQIPSDRCDPVIFNRYLGIDVTTGKHVAIAPDELDLLQNIYYVKPVSNQPNIKGSCPDFESRINVSKQLREENMSLSAATDSFGEQRLVIVASQTMREGVLRGPGVTPQTVESLTDIEYCILERIGRSRWQGEIQTVLNNIVFKQLKSAHIHYMMKSLFQKSLVTKQAYSYVREDKGGKVYQQILLHLPHFKTDARSVSDIRTETICEMLKQTESRSIACSDLRQIISVEGKVFRKLTSKMIASGYVKVESIGSSKQSDKIMTLLKTPSEKQEEEMLDDTLDDPSDVDGESVGLVSELPLTLQGFRHIFSTGENGCSQAMLHRKLKGYGSLEARHLCRKVEKAKIVKIIMIDHGKQRTQKYIADNFATSSSHTKEFFEEKKKMQKIMETSDMSLHPDGGALNTSEVAESTLDESQLNDTRLSENNDLINTTHEGDGATNNNSVLEANTNEITTDSNAPRPDMDCNDADMADTLVKRSKWDTHQTTRKMKRTNTILSFINEQKIVEGFFALQKVLQSEEKDEGLTTKVCKKTVKRLVKKLHDDMLIKHFQIPITSNDCTIEVDFVMSLDCDPIRLKTAIEQAQFKKYSEDSKKIAAEQAEVIDLTGPGPAGLFHNTMNLTDMVKVEDCKPNSKLQYGYQPKFLRNQVVHQYLWYLAYGHPYNDKENLEMLDYDKVREYNMEKNWKRFLPPVPLHHEFGPGWLQVGDAAVLLPLSILCQFHQYPYKIEGLEQYVNDPTRKNTLVRHLPMKMRGFILYKRKYLLSLIQVIENLCFMGLVTFNKQNKNANIRTKKEFEMIYVHRNASMLDTRKSQKGYSEISEGIDYDELQFQFDEFPDVERYWLKLRDVCLMTPLGVRNNDDAEQESGGRHTAKLKLFIADHVARENRDSPDVGLIPGDHRGAGGLDSSLFAHLYRNWFRTLKIVKNNFDDGYDGDENEFPRKKPRRLPKLRATSFHLPEEEPKRCRKKTKAGDVAGKQQADGKRPSVGNVNQLSKKPKLNDSDEEDVVIIEEDDFEYDVVTESNVGRNERVKGGRGQKRPSTTSPQTQAKKKKEIPHAARKKEKYPDLWDKVALRNMNGKSRVSFTSAEDEILLICRITSSVIARNFKIKHKLPSQNVVSGLIIRDLLWKHCKESSDKTSLSCLKRIRILMKNKSAKICHDVNVTEIQNDSEFKSKLFKEVRSQDMLERSEVMKPIFTRCFNEIFLRLRNSRSHPSINLPDTTEELKKSYITRIFSSTRPDQERIVTTINHPRDIALSILENLMYVTLSLNEDEFSQYQAYKIFSGYSNDLIFEVWDHFKSSGIICKKPDMFLNRLRHLPFAVPRYHLSQNHFQFLQVGPMWRIFSELLSSTRELNSNKKLLCDKEASSGAVVLINMLILNEDKQCHLTFASDEEIPKKSTPSAESKEIDTSSTRNDELSGDESNDQDKRLVSKNELYRLYRRKRFFYDAREKFKIIEPVLIDHMGSKVFFEKNFASDISKIIADLDSVKFPSTCNVISLEDETNADRELNSTIASLRTKTSGTLSVLFDRMIQEVNKAGVIGVSLRELKATLHGDPNLAHDQIDECTDLLTSNHIIYIVGMHNKRAVYTKYADPWFVLGTVFKGDRKVLVNEIRRELSQFSSRYSSKKRKIVQKWNAETYAVFQNTISIDSGDISKSFDSNNASESMDSDNELKSVDSDNELKSVDSDNELKSVDSDNALKSVDSDNALKSVDSDNAFKSVDSDNALKSVDSDNAFNSMNCDNAPQSDNVHSSIDVDKSSNSSEVIFVSSTPGTVKNNNTGTPSANKSTNSSCILSDASAYNQVRFLCRPWHNVSGETNYRTAKLLLTGVFVQVFWNPGITLSRLFKHFIKIMQRIALIELLEKLASYKCIERHKCTRMKPWKLFAQFESDLLSSVTSCDDDFYRATPDGLLRMTYLCCELDRLQSERNLTLSLKDTSKKPK